MRTTMVQYALGAAFCGFALTGISSSPRADASSLTESALMPYVVMSQASKEAPDPPKKAVISFTGKGNKSVTVVDHRTNTTETRATSSLNLNLLKEIRVESTRKPSAASDEEVPDAEEAADDKGKDEAEPKTSDDSAEQESQSAEMTEVEKKAAHEADLRSGIKTLQGEGLIVYGDGDAIPETIYDPFTKQYVPVEQAVKALRERQEKAEAEAAQPQ